MIDQSRLRNLAKLAAEHLDEARKSGSPNAVAAAQQDAKIIFKEGDAAKAENDALEAMKAAMLRPIKIRI
jgi:hypothetical protein